MCRFCFARFVGWDEPGVAVSAEVDLPAAVMDCGVVASAQQHAVVDAGVAAAVPWGDVVGVAPGDRPPAARVCAATITDGQPFSDRGGEQPFAAPDIQWCSVAVDDDRPEGAVAGDEVGGGGAD